MNSILVIDLNVETAKFDKVLNHCISLSEDHSNVQAAQKKKNTIKIFKEYIFYSISKSTNKSEWDQKQPNLIVNKDTNIPIYKILKTNLKLDVLPLS